VSVDGERLYRLSGDALLRDYFQLAQFRDNLMRDRWGHGDREITKNRYGAMGDRPHESLRPRSRGGEDERLEGGHTQDLYARYFTFYGLIPTVLSLQPLIWVLEERSWGWRVAILLTSSQTQAPS